MLIDNNQEHTHKGPHVHTDSRVRANVRFTGMRNTQPRVHGNNYLNFANAYVFYLLFYLLRYVWSCAVILLIKKL